MSSLSRTLALVLAAAACLLCCAAEPPAKPTKGQIAQWVRQLGDDDFSAREEASKKLYEAGQPAEEALQEATRSEDAEVVRRASEILDKFRWGLYPDAPKKVVDLVARYRTADHNGKEAVIRELLAAGPPGYRTLVKIAGAEEDPVVRAGVYALLADEVKRVAPRMIADEDYETLELLLDVVLANDDEQGLGQYAAYWLLRGKLDDRIAHFKALAAKGADSPRNWEVVARLCRAKGDLAAAREAAEKADKPELVDHLLFEAADWKALAARPAHGDRNTVNENLGFEAAYRRLAGDADGFEKALAAMRKACDANPGDEYQRFHFAKVLFLNDRPAEGLQVLIETPERQAAAFEMLAAQMRYKDAMTLADKAVEAKAPEAPQLEILKARTLYSLGEKEKAKEIFTRYGGMIIQGVNASWFDTLVDSENRVGLKDQAFEHAARVLSTTRDQAEPTRLFAKLFPKHAEAAETLWAILREKQSDQAPAAAMTRLRDLLDGKATPKDLADLSKQVDDLIKRLPLKSPDEQRCALAEAALAAKDETLARSLLEQAQSPEALVRLGDLEADKKEWDKAAEQYGRAWEKDRGQTLALYLQGWALTQAGKKEEGKKKMELAHWLPLGDAEARAVFLRGLADRGQREAVRREGELMLKVSAPGSIPAAEGIRQVGLDALDRKDYLAAAAGQEQSMLRCLSSGISYLQPAAYLGVPAYVHRLRAQGYTAAGKIDEARKETELGLADLPGDTFFPIELVPAWEKAGHKKEAAELFEQCIAAQEKLCKDYPNCPWGHNSVAWVSACCRRNLESAERHALKAVELAPERAGNLDTLAEVSFQRGDKDKAVEAEKKAIGLEPKRAYFRKQLRRMEAGDPAAERPLEDDGED